MSSLPIKLQLDDSFFKGEWKCDYYVSPLMKKVWAVELDLVNEFIHFCEKYNITYFAIGGTLLGAARHEGFIPWDDDIDICVPRKEFDKMEELAKEYFKAPYFYQTENTDPGFSHHYARIRNSLTTAIPRYDLDCRMKVNQGIWIDIFPVDHVPDDLNERDSWMKELTRLHTKMWAFSRLTLRYKTSLNNDSIVKKARKFAGPILKAVCEAGKIMNPYYKKYETLSKKYVNTDTKFVGLPWFYKMGNKVIEWDKNWFSELIDLPFETLKIKAPEEFDIFLTKTYGDWHKFVIGTSVHHGTLFDPETRYMVYVKDPDKLRLKEKEL